MGYNNDQFISKMEMKRDLDHAKELLTSALPLLKAYNEDAWKDVATKVEQFLSGNENQSQLNEGEHE